jgi:hypothetical protein
VEEESILRVLHVQTREKVGIWSEALMIIGIHEYIAVLMKFRKIMGNPGVSWNFL